MKSIKINRLISSLAAVLLIFGAFFIVKAMEITDNKVLENKVWYFTGDSQSDPEDASNYTLSPANLPPCGILEEVICKIEAPEEAGAPKMDATIEGTTVKLQIRAAHQSILANNPTPNSTVKEFRAE